MAQPSGHQSEPRVFISYARTDSDFAYRLESALIAHGFTVHIDKTGIALGEDWKTRIEGMILASDVVVFILSPDSVTSQVCAWEVERTEEFKKRLLPILWRSVEGLPLPRGLSRANWGDFTKSRQLGFDTPGALEAPVAELIASIKVDIAWVREHTRLVGLAERWRASGQPEGQLLRSDEISVAAHWAERRPKDAPLIPDVLQRFLEAGRVYEQSNRDRLRRTTARAFIQPARQAFATGLFDKTLRYALAAAILADDPDFALTPELFQLVPRAAIESWLQAVLEHHEYKVTSAVFSPNGAKVLTASDDMTACLWDAVTGARLAVLKGHECSVWRAAFSPDEKRVVTASEDKTARVWDAGTGELLAVLSGQEAGVVNAEFSPDSTLIVTLSGHESYNRDRAARVWDAATGEPVAVLETDTYVYGAAFSPDGARVLTVSLDKTPRLWEVASKQKVASLTGHAREVLNATFSPDGSRIVTLSKDGTARIWDAATGAALVVIAGKKDGLIEGNVRTATFCPKGSRVLTTLWHNKNAPLWDAATGAPLAVLRGHESTVRSAVFSLDGAQIVTASEDKTARVWETATGEPLAVLDGHEGKLETAAFSPDRARILTVSEDKTARVWETATGEPLAVLKGHEEQLIGAAFNSDGTRVITRSYDKRARLWNLKWGTEFAILNGHEDKLKFATFSPDGAQILTAAEDRTARVWDARTGELVAVLKGHEEQLLSAAFSPDGKRVVTASQDRTARVWDARTGEALAVLERHENLVYCADFSRDGFRLLTASVNGARLWDAATGELVAVLQAHKTSVTKAVFLRDFNRPPDNFSAAFSPNGNRILVTTDEKDAGLYDGLTGALVAVLKAHGEILTSAAFSPDSTKVVTAAGHENYGEDFTAHLWEAATGEYLRALQGHEDGVTSAAFSPDGAKIVTASVDNSARVWEVATGKQIAAVETRQGQLRSAVFSPEGGRILTAFKGESSRLWDAGTGKFLAVLDGHKGSAAMFSPDGAWILSALGDKNAGLWDASAGFLVTIFRGHRGRVTSAAFSPGGARVVTASVDGTARLWDTHLAGAFSIRPRVSSLVARLTAGAGVIAGSEKDDILLHEAPGDLCSEALGRFPGIGACVEKASALFSRTSPLPDLNLSTISISSELGAELGADGPLPREPLAVAKEVIAESSEKAGLRKPPDVPLAKRGWFRRFLGT